MVPKSFINFQCNFYKHHWLAKIFEKKRRGKVKISFFFIKFSIFDNLFLVLSDYKMSDVVDYFLFSRETRAADVPTAIFRHLLLIF